MAKCKVNLDTYNLGLNACDLLMEDISLNQFADKDYPKKLKEKVLKNGTLQVVKGCLRVIIELTEEESNFFYFLAGFGLARVSCKGDKWLKVQYDVNLMQEEKKKSKLD